jgi:murein tripeptide amidase MpaA
MINPDGVVFGNYRTSLSGKDLNRKFKNISRYAYTWHLKSNNTAWASDNWLQR